MTAAFAWRSGRSGDPELAITVRGVSDARLRWSRKYRVPTDELIPAAAASLAVEAERYFGAHPEPQAGELAWLARNPAH